MTVQIQVTKPERCKGRGKVSVRPGEDVELTTNPRATEGDWFLGNSQVKGAVDKSAEKLAFVKSRGKDDEGQYVFRAQGQESTPIELTLRASPRRIFRRAGQAGWYRRMLTHKNKLAFVAVVVVYAAVIAVMLKFPDLLNASTPGWITFRSYLFAGATLGLILFLVGMAAAQDGKGAFKFVTGLASLFKGADRRVSTSKFQYLLWTFGVAFALAYIVARAILANHGFECKTTMPHPHRINCVPAENWDAYLILLGVPAATAVVAKGVTSYQVVNGSVQKVPAPEGAARVADLATNDAGQADIADVQYLIFNVIAFGYFAIYFFAKGTLVAIPAILLGLTSASAATYALNKSLQADKPVIQSVSPSVISPGTQVRIRGVNLFPPGSKDRVTVKIGGFEATGQRADKSQDICVEAPPEISDTDPTVRVITDANIETAPYQVTILGTPRIAGLTGVPMPGEPLGIVVEGMPPQRKKVEVKIKGFIVDGTTPKGDVGPTTTVTVTVPIDGLNDKETVEISVGVDGRWSKAVQETVRSPA